MKRWFYFTVDKDCKNREEDRERWWKYVVQGKVPAWQYFVKFEGMTEDDAKAMVEEAKPKEEPGFFKEE